MDDELPKVTPSMLRDVSEGACPRRLALMFEDLEPSSPTSNGRFRLANRFEDAADRAQIEMSAPRRDLFDPPADLRAEEQILYARASDLYLRIFEHPARSVAGLEWQVPLPELGIRLSMRRPLAFERSDGTHELRLLSLRRRPRRPFPDQQEIELNVLRAAAWFGEGSLCITSADLVHGVAKVCELETASERGRILADLDAGVQRIRSTVDRERPTRGAACGFCEFLPCKGNGGPFT